MREGTRRVTESPPKGKGAADREVTGRRWSQGGIHSTAPERPPVPLSQPVGEAGQTAGAAGPGLALPQPPWGARPAPRDPTRRAPDLVALTEAEKQPRHSDAGASGRGPEDPEGRAPLPPGTRPPAHLPTCPRGQQPHPACTQLRLRQMEGQMEGGDRGRMKRRGRKEGESERRKQRKRPSGLAWRFPRGLSPSEPRPALAAWDKGQEPVGLDRASVHSRYVFPPENHLRR